MRVRGMSACCTLATPAGETLKQRWRPAEILTTVAGVTAVTLGGFRFVELTQADLVFAFEGYPTWLPAYLASLDLSLVLLGGATALFALFGRRVGSAGGPLAAMIVLTVAVHGWFLFVVDHAQGMGGFIPGVFDVLTLARRHDAAGASPVGATGYRLGQGLALCIALTWPAFIMTLAAGRPRRSWASAVTVLGILGAGLAAIVLACTTVAPRLQAALADVPSGWQIVSDGSTYQLAYPPSWRVQPGDPLTVIDDVTGPHANCNLIGYATPTWAGLDASGRQARLDTELDVGEYGNVLERRRESVAGRPGLVVVADRDRTGPNGVTELRMVQWLAPFDGGVYQLTCTTYRQTFESRRPAFERIAQHLVVPAA